MKRQQCEIHGRVWSLFILLSNHISKVSYSFSPTLKPYMLQSPKSKMLRSTFNECVYPKSGIWKRAGVWALLLALPLSCVMSGNLSDPLFPHRYSGNDAHGGRVTIS